MGKLAQSAAAADEYCGIIYSFLRRRHNIFFSAGPDAGDDYFMLRFQPNLPPISFALSSMPSSSPLSVTITVPT